MNRAYYGQTEQTKIFLGPTGSSKGTQISKSLILGDVSASSAFPSLAGSTNEVLEFVPPQTANLLVEITNNETSAVKVEIYYNFFEV